MSSDGDGKIAVFLNANARKVSEGVRRRMRRVAPGARIHLTRSKEQAQRHLREALASGYRRVVAGGGDGTLMTVASAIRSEVEAIRARLAEESPDGGGGAPFPLPELGILKLGTGNAVADVLRARDPVRDLRDMAGLPTVPLTRLDLLDVENVLAPFCGFGYDGMILNDYMALKERARGPLMKAFLEGVQGYLVAAFLRSLPRRLFQRRRIVARVLNAGGSAYQVSYTHGLTRLDVPEGAVLYSGPVTMLACGTIPYYGFKFTMFPFARILPGMAHLRIARSSPLEAVRNLPAVWKGTYSSPTIEEFLVERIRIRFSEPMPFQVGGDAAGYRKELALGVHDEPFQVFELGADSEAA